MSLNKKLAVGILGVSGLFVTALNAGNLIIADRARETAYESNKWNLAEEIDSVYYSSIMGAIVGLAAMAGSIAYSRKERPSNIIIP